MAGLDTVVAQALEASRLKELVLGQQARQISEQAGLLLEALREGKTVHLLGDEALGPLSAYLAGAFHRGDGRRALPVRLLAGGGASPGVVQQAAQVFVNPGEVVLVLANSFTLALEGALNAVAAREACVLGILGQEASRLVERCDVAVGIPSRHAFVVAETVLAMGHVLQSLVIHGLQHPPQRREAAPPSFSPPPPRPLPAPPAPLPATAPATPPGPSFADLDIIDRDPAGGFDSATISDELEPLPDPDAQLLARELEAGRHISTDARRPGPIRFRCGGCEEIIRVAPRFAGRRGQCPYCRAEFVIPTPTVQGEVPRVDPLQTVQTRSGVHARPPAEQPPQGSGSRPARPLRGGSSAERRPLAGASGSSAERPASGKRKRRRRERRRAPRFAVKDALVRLSRTGYPDGRGQHEPHGLDDLSLTGLRFIARPGAYEVGEEFYFTVDVPAFPRPIRFKGEVRRVLPRDDGRGVGVGVRFLEYVGDAQKRIRRLLENVPLRGVRRR